MFRGADGKTIRKLIRQGEFPDDLADAVRAAYREMSERYEIEEVAVAVRSSATAEDLPEASFAGQQETYLNVTGEADLLDACRKCYASLFTDRAIAYREEHGFQSTSSTTWHGGPPPSPRRSIPSRRLYG